MQLFIILLLLSGVYSLPIYKKELRNMHELEQRSRIAQFIIGDADGIYNQVLREALKGKNEYKFVIRCSHIIRNNGECYLKRPEEEQDSLYKIPYEAYTKLLLKRLNQIFPDSDIAQITQNKQTCCDYLISW